MQEKGIKNVITESDTYKKIKESSIKGYSWLSRGAMNLWSSLQEEYSVFIFREVQSCNKIDSLVLPEDSQSDSSDIEIYEIPHKTPVTAPVILKNDQ